MKMRMYLISAFIILAMAHGGGVYGSEIFKSVNPTVAAVGDTVTWSIVAQSGPSNIGSVYSSGTTWGGTWTNQVAGSYSWGITDGALWYDPGCGTETVYPQYIYSTPVTGDAEFTYDTIIPSLTCQPLEDSVFIFRNVACDRFYMLRLDHYQGIDGCPLPITGTSKLFYGKATPNGAGCGTPGVSYFNSDTDHYGASIDCVAKNTWYSMRVRTCGITIMAKTWQAGSTEPIAWQLTTTDSDLATYTSGTFGFQANTGSTAFRNLVVSSISSETVTITDNVPSCLSNVAVVGSPSKGTVDLTGNTVRWNVGIIGDCDLPVSLTISSVIGSCTVGSLVRNDAVDSGGATGTASLSIAASSASLTPTNTPTRTNTATPTQTPTNPTSTSTATFTRTNTSTPTGTDTTTATASPTPTSASTVSIQLTNAITAPTTLYTSGNIALSINVCNSSVSATANGVTVTDLVTQGAGNLSWCGPYGSYTLLAGGATVTIGASIGMTNTTGWQTVDNLPAGYCVPVTFCLTDLSVGSHSCITILNKAVASWPNGSPVTSAQMAVTYPCASASDTFTPTLSFTDTPSFTSTRTPTPANTPTTGVSVTATWTMTSGAGTATYTPTPDPTPIITPGLTLSPTFTVTPSRTWTATSTPFSTDTSTATQTWTPTDTSTKTHTPTPTFSATQTWTWSVSMTSTPTPTSSLTLTPTETSDITPRETPTPTYDERTHTYIYPSPVKGPRATIAYQMKGPGRVRIRVWNAGAEWVAEVDECKPAGSQTSVLTVGDYAPGVYLYRVLLDYDSGAKERLSTVRFVVLR